MQHIVMVGGPLDAKRLVGPFDSFNEAKGWIDKNQVKHAWACPLESPTAKPVANKPEMPAIFPEEAQFGVHFTFGKYRGVEIERVLGTDPQYINWAYINVGERSGISDTDYRKACKMLGQKPEKRAPVGLSEPAAPPPPPKTDYGFCDDDIPF